MSKVRKFLDTIGDLGKFIVGLPVGIATVGGVAKAVSQSIAQPQVAKVLSIGGDKLLASAKWLGGVYKSGAKIGLRFGVATAKKSAPVVTTIAKSIPGSRFVPGILKSIPMAGILYATAAGAYKATEQIKDIAKLKGSAMSRLSYSQKYDMSKPLEWLRLIKDTSVFK